jgi:hypothetical protein
MISSKSLRQDIVVRLVIFGNHPEEVSPATNYNIHRSGGKAKPAMITCVTSIKYPNQSNAKHCMKTLK